MGEFSPPPPFFLEKILDPCLIVLYITYIYKCQNSNSSYTFLQIFKRGTNVLDVESFNGQAIG